MRESKITIFEVAELAGVSIKTVSRVVNREPNVREQTRQRVNAAISELDYRPDRSARNLASQRSHLIGLVYDDPAAYELPSSGYIIRLQQGALLACRAAGHELLIHPCDFRKRSTGRDLVTLIQDTKLSGLVLAAPLSNMPKIVRSIQSTNTPFVRIAPGKAVRNQPCVITDDQASSAKMVEYLAELGHERIAFLKGDTVHAAVSNRYLGYLDGMEQAGLAIRQQLIKQGNNSFNSGIELAEQLLRRKNRPTAIFAANDDMAAGVIRVAKRLSLSIPDDLSVAGFDDIILARQIDPMLTTVRQPLRRMAESAVTMLTGDHNGKRELFESISATLKIRESTGPAPTSVD
ncbi:MAG: LacI family DNA-binding transcriptional regulator [Woeseiaceae bacterium]